MLDIIYVRKYLAGNQKVHPATCEEVLSISYKLNSSDMIFDEAVRVLRT